MLHPSDMSAIKAKLLDLGAYVDDELPDYIMVMVANKKTKAQMTEDLNLFLGTHTDKFTSWLHSLLCKLQSITAEMTPGGDGGEQTGKDKQLLEEKAWAAATGSSGGGEKVEKAAEVAANQKPAQSSSGSKQSADKPSITEESTEVQEPEINLRPEHDEFEEEVQAEMEKQKKVAKSTERRKRVSSHGEKGAGETSTVKDKSGTQISPKRRRHSKGHAEKATSHVSPRRRLSSKDAEHKSVREEKDKSSQGQASSHGERGRKKRPLTSSVGAVIKHDVYASDEEYDPLNPAVGNVASVVKVTERKSSLPPEMQPNKSLLLKAMHAAHKSIETATQKLTTKAIVKPMMRSKEAKVDHSSGQEASQKEQEVVETRSVNVRSRLGARHKPSMSERLGEGRTVELVTRSSKEGNRRIMNREISDDSEEELKSKKSKASDREAFSSHMDTVEQKDDSRKFEVTVTRNVQRKKKKKKSSSRSRHGRERGTEGGSEGEEEEDLVKILIDRVEEESDFTEGEEEGRIDRERDGRSHMRRTESVASDVDPKFVVTLDGVETVAMEKEDVVEDRRLVSPAKNVVMVKPQRPAVDPVLINLSEDNDEDCVTGIRTAPATTSALESPEVQKVQEKCRFWPACKTGELCPYVHPTTQCMKFPACHFGERCLYIHPACKFDGQCSRPGCPYTHSSKRSVIPTQPSILLQPVRVPLFTPRPPVPAPVAPRAGNPKDLNCRFFPNCTNMDCTFRHPKPCRFGVGCVQKDTCYFYHPSLPNKGQLRWSAQASKKPELISQQSSGSLTTP